MSHQTDFCILGAGIAGLSLADALSQKGFSITIVDKESVAAGASGTPGGLVNPATGRRAKKVWQAENCYTAIASNLEKVQQQSNSTFYLNNGVLRPALMQKMARKMREQYEQTAWPDGWCEWKGEGEIKEIHPGISCVDGGLWLPIGLTVDVGAYLHAYSNFLKAHGTNFYLNQDTVYIRPGDYRSIDLQDTTIACENLVFATGHTIATSPYWDWIPVNLIKGQVAKFRTFEEALSFDHSISSLGYMARLDDRKTLVQGSTYEHDYEHLKPDQQGEEYLRKRLRRTLPKLEQKVETVDQWAGVRTSTPNYKPILGRHPVHDNMHLFGGLGSKGLLFGKFLADLYADHLTDNTSLYPEISIARFRLS
jgi:glycine/D-amino acid oxidase-like deaminating enzyme